MFRIAKKFAFSASHTLALPGAHKCSRLHGHNYIVELTLGSADLDEHGFIVDYGELSSLNDFLNERFDHKHLNDVMDVEPTAENIAKTVFEFARSKWPQTAGVRVSETPNTWAEYAPNNSTAVADK
jgi:6-pyruvoyltetrahydropterin/6-carboxytetrahydropterin synthase